MIAQQRQDAAPDTTAADHHDATAETDFNHRYIISDNGAPGGDRTHNLRLRRPTLYPIELQAWQLLKYALNINKIAFLSKLVPAGFNFVIIQYTCNAVKYLRES